MLEQSETGVGAVDNDDDDRDDGGSRFTGEEHATVHSSFLFLPPPPLFFSSLFFPCENSRGQQIELKHNYNYLRQLIIRNVTINY